MTGRSRRSLLFLACGAICGVALALALHGGSAFGSIVFLLPFVLAILTGVASTTTV